MPVSIQYQLAELYKPQRGTWRIQWYNLHPETGVLQRIQKTFGINRITCMKERKRVATEYILQLNAALKNGYNYFRDTEGVAGAAVDYVSLGKMIEQITAQRCIGKKKRTAESFNNYSNVFCNWLRTVDRYSLPPAVFTAAMYNEFIVFKHKQGSGNRNINDYTNYLKTVFKIAVKLSYINRNPIDGIDYLPVHESTRFTAFTTEELRKVSTHLMCTNIRFYIYTKFIALEFIRPYHLQYIRACDIDYEKDLIRLTPQSSKNNKVTFKQLLPDLKKFLLQYKFHELSGEYYIFGRKFEPSPTPWHRLSKDASQYWKKEIMEKVNIKKHMYSLKHTGSTYYVTENEFIDAAWLQHQMEHSSLEVTELYIQRRKTKKIDTERVKTVKY